MQPTTLGSNRTGAALTPAALEAMKEAADALTPATEIDMTQMEEQKLAYTEEAESVGSIPPPTSVKGVVKSGVEKMRGGQPSVLLDKIGERLAFERTGTRLYEALLIKCRAAEEFASASLPNALLDGDGGAQPSSETPAETLTRIRNEELEHFGLLCDAVVALGGDPTAQTPSADVVAMASSGIMQVLNDPRTTLAQCLNVMLTAELTDNAGWELLISLAEEAGESDLAGKFMGALGQEQEHLAIIKNWVTQIVAEEPRPELV